MNPLHAGPRMNWGALAFSIGTLTAVMWLAAARLLGLWLLLFLLVAEIVVYQAFSVLVRRRAHDLALLRCFGASRGQVFNAVLAEAAFVGTLAAVTGTGGVAIVLDLQGLAFPMFAAAVGVGGAVLAAIVPAFRASRVPPAGPEGNGRV
jgi:ABC-type lipoprotein release transport system permease subunit